MFTKRLDSGWEHHRGSFGGVWEVWRKDKLNNHYNVPWEPVELPHCFNASDSVDPDTLYYEGPGWYRILLDVDNPFENGRTLLHFEGSGQHTDVYVFTERVGSHIGGYDEFTIDITEAVNRAGYREIYGSRVPVAIRCDNTRNLETIPSDVSDFNLYGGIYRYLNLVYVPPVSLARVHIHTEEVSAESASIRVEARLYKPQVEGETLLVRVEVRDPSGRQIHQEESAVAVWEGERALTEFAVSQPELWHPDHPALYTCAVTLQSGNGGRVWKTGTEERFGLRYFQFVRKGPFLLNGERLLLRGTHRHEDHAGVAAAMTKQMILDEMRQMKEMGVNFIRLGHYQQSRIVLDLCDELGILVWEEIPWCRGGIGGEAYRRMCRDMLGAMIDQHRNHPSVIIWGLGNENDWEADFDTFDTEKIRTFMAELHRLSHELDDSRVTAIRRCEFCKDIVDVYSPSIWAGWYRGIYPEYETYSKAGFDGTDRFFHMEWGADNLAGRHAEHPYTGFEEIRRNAGADERDGDYLLTGGDPRVSSLGDWSETYFCDMIDWYLKTQERMDWLTGTAQWAFKDFSTPVRPDSPIPYMNLKGVVQRDGIPKEAYYVFQSYWTDKPMARIYGHSWKVRWGAEDEAKTVKVYSNCSQAELFLNGVSCGVRYRDPQNFPAAGLRWELAFKPGVNELRVVAEKDGVTVEDIVKLRYQTETWGTAAELRLTSFSLDDGTVMVEAEAFDASGVFCADAADFVRFGLAGDGRMLDNRGTVTGSRYIQLANGKARIRIDPRGGSSAISVSADGIQTAFHQIKG
jgi:beta-galactosidase